jgi:hypothetical protein
MKGGIFFAYFQPADPSERVSQVRGIILLRVYVLSGRRHSTVVDL